MTGGRIVSLQVGQPQTLTTDRGREWTSAIRKEPVVGKVALGKKNLEGDTQANQRYHGGPDKAVCVYCAEHYPFWNEVLGQEISFGAFGENLTIEGITEDMLCVGDILTLGNEGVRIQISQPRQPCVNLAKRWSRRDLPGRMEETGWTGFYARAIQTGEIATGDAMTLIERPHEGWTLLRANQIMYAKEGDPGEITALRSLTYLTAEWKRILGRKLAKLSGG